MIRIHAALAARGLRGKMLLQVHDELVFEVPNDEMDAVTELVRVEMEHAADLSVPLVVDVGVGDNWLATKMDELVTLRTNPHLARNLAIRRVQWAAAHERFDAVVYRRNVVVRITFYAQWPPLGIWLALPWPP